MTVALTAYSAYFTTNSEFDFIYIIGDIMVLTGLIICFIFSWKSERANLYIKELWELSYSKADTDIAGYKFYCTTHKNILKEMKKDPMNWLMGCGGFFIVGIFYYYNLCK